MGQRIIGFFVNFLLTLTCCLLLIDLTALLNQKRDISQTARRYLLKMEADGYLTAEDSARLVADLNQLGVTEVSLAGTTVADAGYGNDVVLQFSGNLHYTDVRLLSLFQPEETEAAEGITERIISTAKN